MDEVLEIYTRHEYKARLEWNLGTATLGRALRRTPVAWLGLAGVQWELRGWVRTPLAVRESFGRAAGPRPGRHEVRNTLYNRKQPQALRIVFLCRPSRDTPKTPSHNSVLRSLVWPVRRLLPVLGSNDHEPRGSMAAQAGKDAGGEESPPVEAALCLSPQVCLRLGETGLHLPGKPAACP